MYEKLKVAKMLRFRSYILRVKYWMRNLFCKSDMEKQIKDINIILKNKEGTVNQRKEMLMSILSYAKTNVKFYSKVKGASLQDFPVINKQIILENYDHFKASIKSIPGQIGAIHIQKTSGSTGTPFEIQQDTLCRARRIALIKAANELIGFHPYDALMHLRAVKHYWKDVSDITWRKDLNILYVDNANLTEEKVKRIVESIDMYDIKFIRGYMTTLDTITRFMVESQYKPKNLLTFISVGELLQEPLRNRIVNELKCRVISQYGNEENGVLGQSKINGSGSIMDLYLSNSYVEILKIDSDQPVEEGELGRVVVTDYTNHAMPMIRYDIGDLAMVGARLSTGEISQIKNLAGRKTDLIYRTDGVPIDFFNSISPEIYNNPLVRQWQFIQESEKKYDLVLCVSDKLLEDKAEYFAQQIRDQLGPDAEIEVVFVDEIPVLNSGKRKIVINKYIKS